MVEKIIYGGLLKLSMALNVFSIKQSENYISLLLLINFAHSHFSKHYKWENSIDRNSFYTSNW